MPDDKPVPDAASGSGRRWLTGLIPLLLVAAVAVLFLRAGPVGVFRQAFPPVEELTIERVWFPTQYEIRVRVTNGGPEPVTVAQVMVDDANWTHALDGDRTIGRLASRTITIPYPWIPGEPHVITLVSRNGLTFSHEVPVATLAPAVDGRYLGTFALLGIYAGVVPVFLGLLWLPFLRSIPGRWVDFFLSLTMGLLVFLGVDALQEAMETAAKVPAAFQGKALVLLGVLGTPLGIWALSRRRSSNKGAQTPLYVATLIAFGIGLHNLGEGLAIGSAYSTGEIGLGTFLVVGFLLHNSTEGLGIVAPLATERPPLVRLVALGALAGLPTVVGSWIGGFSHLPLLTTLFFAVGAGAIAQVVYELWRLLTRRAEHGLAAPLNAVGILVGLLLMYATGLLVAA